MNPQFLLMIGAAWYFLMGPGAKNRRPRKRRSLAARYRMSMRRRRRNRAIKRFSKRAYRRGRKSFRRRYAY
jgi:hypothetical protein